LFIATVVSTGKYCLFRGINPNSSFSVKMEDKKGILYKGGCLCGKMIFEIIRGIQENIFANKAVLRL